MGELKPSLVGMFIGSFLCSYFMNSVSGVNVSMLVFSARGRSGFEP